MIKNIKIIMKNGWARVIMKNLNHQIKPNNQLHKNRNLLQEMINL